MQREKVNKKIEAILQLISLDFNFVHVHWNKSRN